MKIRNGFVSNSSSSSFIVAFPRIPLNWHDVRVMMFGDNPDAGVAYPFAFDGEENEFYSADQVAQTVFTDMQERSMVPMHEEIIARAFEELESLDYLGEYFKETDEKKREKLRIEADKKRLESAKIKAKEFIKENKGCFVYELEYADDSGRYGATLEHGEIFSKLPHIRVSHH